MQDGGGGIVQGSHIHTAAVQRNGADGQAVGLVDPANLLMTRFFQTKTVVPPQQLNQNVIEIFGAGADDDAVRIHGHAAAAIEHTGNGTAQIDQTGVGRRQQKLIVLVKQNAAHELGPDGEREVSGTGRRRHRCSSGDGCADGDGSGRTACFQHFGIVTGSGPGEQVALCQQLVIGIFHSDAADAQMVCQSTLGGQLFTACNDTGENVFFQGAIELFIQGNGCFRIQNIGVHRLAS